MPSHVESLIGFKNTGSMVFKQFKAISKKIGYYNKFNILLRICINCIDASLELKGVRRFCSSYISLRR